MSSPSIHVLDSVLDFPSAEDGNGQSAGSEFSRSLFKNLVASTKSSQVLPVGDDFKYMETFPEFKDSSKRISEKSLGLILKLAGWIQPDPVPSAENLLDDVERYEVALDSIDISLERVDSYLYKLKNGGKESQPSPAPNLIDVVTPYAKKKRKESRPQVINALFKPQLKFKRAVDNSWIPFVPAIIDKPNAKHPLPDYRAVESELKDNRMQWVPWIRQDIAKDPYIPHPYQSEVETFVVPNRQLGIASEKLFRPLKEVECRWIDDEDQLSELSTILESQLEFAIDLEAHSLRSYQGITCLMQVSQPKINLKIFFILIFNISRYLLEIKTF